jgi:hypothetical protein
MVRSLVVLTAFVLGASPAYADVERCVCYCGELIPAPCPNVEEQCKKACHWKGGEGKDDSIQAPPPPPVEVTKVRAARDALDRGDLDAALNELQAAKAANRCFAPTFQLLGDLYLRAPSRWSCRLDAEPAPCQEVAAYELWWGATGCDGRMQGLDADSLAQLRARAAPLYDAAYQSRSRRLARRVLNTGQAKLEAGDGKGAEGEFRYVIGLFEGAIRPTTEDADYGSAYKGLSSACELQGRWNEAIAALDGWARTPFARAYGGSGTTLGMNNDLRKSQLMLKTGCQLVLVNKTGSILNLYLSPGSDKAPACRALGWKDELVEPPPGAPCFCSVHGKPGTTYLLSVKRVFQTNGRESEEAAFWQNSPAPGYWCEAGKTFTWTVWGTSK